MQIDLNSSEMQAFEDALLYYSTLSGEGELVTADTVNETLRRLGSPMRIDPMEFLAPAIREIAQRWKHRMH